jgi:hypothetical protein
MNVRNHGRRRKKAPRDLFSLNPPPPVKARTPPKRTRAQEEWDRYIQSLRDKDLHRQRREAAQSPNTD